MVESLLRARLDAIAVDEITGVSTCLFEMFTALGNLPGTVGQELPF
jgi:hypothetical protein